MSPRNAAKSNPALRLALIRQLHVYLSVFIAPTLLFFAVTGALQTYRIPDRPDASVALQKLARLHKDDVFAVKPPPPKRPAAAPGAEGAAKAGPKPERTKPPEPRATKVFKVFAVAVSLAFIVTTLLGLWMGLAYNRSKKLMWAVLLAGIAVPVIIVALL